MALRDHVSPLVGGFLAYLINQHVFFWWHYARHAVYVLWLLLHQFHHSPSRLQTPTAFYKHPLEILADSFIMAFLVYSVLGLSKDSSLWLSFFSALGEYFYHMNLRTPQWIGYFFQRPESHRLHHGRNKREHCPNYSDFPLWDWLGGTFENPKEMNEPTGFGPVDRECRRWDMLCFKDVVGISGTNLSWDVPGWDLKKAQKDRPGKQGSTPWSSGVPRAAWGSWGTRMSWMGLPGRPWRPRNPWCSPISGHREPFPWNTPPWSLFSGHPKWTPPPDA